MIDIVSIKSLVFNKLDFIQPVTHETCICLSLSLFHCLIWDLFLLFHLYFTLSPHHYFTLSLTGHLCVSFPLSQLLELGGGGLWVESTTSCCRWHKFFWFFSSLFSLNEQIPIIFFYFAKSWGCLDYICTSVILFWCCQWGWKARIIMFLSKIAILRLFYLKV